MFSGGDPLKKSMEHINKVFAGKKMPKIPNFI